MPDHLIRAMIPALNVRLVAALTTDLSRDAAARHQTSPAAACALSRGLTAGLLLATLTKSEERVTLQLLANGPLRGLNVDAYGDGLVRGYPLAAKAAPEANMARRQRLADLIGRDGVVNVVRDVGLRDRYQGQVALVTSEVDEDVEAYLRESEQIPSAVGCEVIMEPAGDIVVAGGLLAQIMPDSPPETKGLLLELQHTLRSGELYDLLKTKPDSARALLALAAGPYADNIDFLDERPLAFQCRCDKLRIETMVRGMELADIDAMIEEGKSEVTCNYCGAVYELSKDDLLRLRAEKPPREQQ